MDLIIQLPAAFLGIAKQALTSIVAGLTVVAVAKVFSLIVGWPQKKLRIWLYSIEATLLQVFADRSGTGLAQVGR